MERCAKTRRTFFWEEPVFEGATTVPHVDVKVVSDGLWVATPRLPRGLDPTSVTVALRDLFTRMCEVHAIERPIHWFYTPMMLPIARDMPRLAVVYDCMDELSGFKGAPPELPALESALFEVADVVFTGGRSLYHAKREHHDRVHAFPSSVDSAHFARARADERREPADQRFIARPRLGYCGVIDERVDMELLARVADARPGWQIVLIGPIVKIDPETVPRRRNIHHLGPKLYPELPSYLGGWDVALMPFKLDASTRFISPTKTLEYLAAGLPVVSTAIHDVVHPYGDAGVVHVGDHSDFVECIEEALGEPAEARIAAADALVAGTSWDGTWSEMEQLLAEVLDEGSSVRSAPAQEGELSCTTT
jgi:UDP-galactopyranose mutase